MAIKTALGALRYNNRMKRIWNKCQEANKKYDLLCPKCGSANVDKAFGHKLNKCLSCQLAFD